MKLQRKDRKYQLWKICLRIHLLYKWNQPNRCQIVESEMITYKTESCIPLASNPLTQWKDSEYKYLLLSALAKCYLGIPARSVPSERVFLTTGDIITAQRSALSEHVDQLIFLNKNVKVCNTKSN